MNFLKSLKKKYRYGGKIKNKDVDSHHEMDKQINEIGGSLHFVMKIDQEGWFAECKEFPGIITGGENTNPSTDEVNHSVIESIKTAFNVPINELDKVEFKNKPKTNKRVIPMAMIERPLQLA